MLKIIALNSFRGGTGKSNVTANLAAILAQKGYRVGVVDTDLPSPGIHIVLGLEQANIDHTLNDYLWGNCSILQATHDVTPAEILDTSKGHIFLAPASFELEDINRIVQEGYDIDRLSGGINQMAKSLQLDFLFLDTHPGLNQETLLAMALADRLMLILRPDSQDFQGTAVTADVSQQLGVPKIFILLNRVLPAINGEQLKNLVQKSYNLPLAGILENSDDMMMLASRSLFCLRYPDHSFSQGLRSVAAFLEAN